MTHNINNTVLEDIPEKILARTAGIENPRTRLAVSCGLLNKKEEAAFKGPRGDPVSSTGRATRHESLNAAISRFLKVMEAGGYDEPYYDPATDSHMFEFSVRHADEDRRVRVRGDDPDDLAGKIRAFTAKTKRRIKDETTGGIYIVMGPSERLMAAVKEGTYGERFFKFTGARLRNIGVVEGTSGGNPVDKFVAGADPDNRMKIQRLEKKHGDFNNLLEAVLDGTDSIQREVPV